MMTDLSLDELRAKDLIVDCINRLFVGTDNRDWTMVQGCLAEKVHFDMTSLSGGEPVTLTPVQITAAWAEGLKALAAVHHQAGNYRVQVRGGEADGFCYGTATHYRPTRSGRNVRTFVGSYDFQLRLQSGEWRITLFRFNLKYLDGNLELQEAE